MPPIKVSIPLPAELHAQLMQYAQRRGLTQRQAVEQLLLCALDAPWPQPEPTPLPPPGALDEPARAWNRL